MKRILSLAVLFSALLISVYANNFRTYRNSQLSIQNDEVRLNVQNADDEVSFLAIGDWGGLPVYPYRTVIEKKVSSEMTRLALKHNTSFQLAIGDNFYTKGIKDSDDKRFQETYENVFNSEPLKNTPWFMGLGNHDHYGNASAQVEYTNKSHRWILPSYNYTIDINLNENQSNLIHIMVLDTVLMCGNSGSDFEHVPPRYKSLKEKLVGQDYFNWVEKRLNQIGQSDVPYLLVVGHFPVWSIAEHGPTDCLVNKLRPLLHQNKVTAYLSGHDHNLQHLRDTYLDQSVDYIVTGASNYMDNSTEHASSVPPNSLKFHWAEGNVLNGGFVLAKATENNMTITFFETNKKELYQTVLYPRNNKNN